ncbi:methyl-accepting chemotaxis protein [Aeromonas salmonicida]|uniref:methyl-accepting chemotaxis protein n=1 Tax=Aeromonas salmonicida TaxID=645 RepID=UPI0030A95578
MTDHKTAETTAFWDPVSWASCLGIGLLSTLLLVLAGSPLPYLLANGALALGAAVWNSHHYHNKQESRPHEEEQAHTWSAAQLNHSIIGLEQVCEKAVPIWSQQIENSRLQTEEAMIDLTQRFAGLTTKLEEAGRGFAVVADEVRTLSRLSSETAQKMTDKVDTINTGIGRTFQIAESAAARDQAAVSDSERAIEQVLERFRMATTSLSESAVLLQSESAGIHREISDVIVSLQFQDRVSQILNHVRQNMDSLYDHLVSSRNRPHQSGPLQIDADSWLRWSSPMPPINNATFTTAAAKPLWSTHPAIQTSLFSRRQLCPKQS